MIISMSGYVPSYSGSACSMLTPNWFSISGSAGRYAVYDRSVNVVGYFPPSMIVDADCPMAKLMPTYSAYLSSNGHGPANILQYSGLRYCIDPDIVVKDAYLTASASLSLRKWDTSRSASANYYAEFRPNVRIFEKTSGYSATASQYTSANGYNAIGMHSSTSSFTSTAWEDVDSLSFTASAASARIYNLVPTGDWWSEHLNRIEPIFIETIQNCDVGFTFKWGLSGQYWRQS